MGLIKSVSEKERPTTPPMAVAPRVILPAPPPPESAAVPEQPKPKSGCGGSAGCGGSPGGGGAKKEMQSGPRYVRYRTRFARFIGKGCARCGGDPPGWVQRQVETPYRFKRSFLWLVNLVPRFGSFTRVLFGRRVSFEAQVARHEKCQTCPGMHGKDSWTPGLVIELRVVKGAMTATRFCGLCDCPRWRIPKFLRWILDVGSHLDYKITKKGLRCPLGRHEGSNPDFVYLKHIDEVSKLSVKKEPS